MNADHIVSIAAFALWVATAVVIFVGRNWLLARISKGVQHHFDLKLEEIRAELRKSEESFKSDLRDKENEIATLRSAVLAGSANRQSHLDKRRFEAVERIWTAVNDMAVFKGLATSMAVLDFKAVAKRATEPKIQKFLDVIHATTPDYAQFKNIARDERPFVPDLAWAYFSAYWAILSSSYLRLQVLRLGIEEPEKLLSKGGLQKIVTAALPHQRTFIEENEPETYFYLLDEIELSLLSQLRNILKGTDADQADADRAKKILQALSNAQAEQQAQQAKKLNDIAE